MFTKGQWSWSTSVSPTFLSNSFKALNIFSDGVFLLLLKTASFGLKQVLSNFYAIGFLWRRCNFCEKETFRQAQYRKCRARYHDVAKTTCGIRQSNYLPLLLYRIPLKYKLFVSCSPHHVFLGRFFTFEPQCYLGYFWYWYFTAVFASFFCAVFIWSLYNCWFLCSAGFQARFCEK